MMRRAILKRLKPESRSAGVFRRGAKILVLSRDRTTAGVFISNGWMKLASIRDSAEELGQLLVEALGKSKSAVPHPEDWDAILRPIWTAIGTTSYSMFLKGTTNCDAYLVGSSLALTPMKNGGVRGGLLPVSESAMHLSWPADYRAIGDAIIQSLDISQEASGLAS